MADGKVIQGVRWIADAAGRIVGYRNPVVDKDEDLSAAALQGVVSGERIFYPESEGAVGTADDSAPVLAALAKAIAAGGVMRLSRGRTYTIRNIPITGAVTIEADGATIQYGGSYGTVAPLESVPVIMYGAGTVGTPIRGITVRGGTWIGNRVPGSYNNVDSGAADLLQFYYCPDTLITSAEFKECGQDAVTFANSTGSKVAFCRGYDVADGFVEFRAGGGYSVLYNYVERVRHIAVCKPNIDGALVHGNRGSTFQQGIVGHGNDWTITDNTIDVYDTPDSILGNSQPAIEWSDYGGLVTPSDTYRTVISGNTIRNRTNANGIHIKAPASAFVPYDITISANSIACRRGVLLERGVNVTVADNTIRGGAGGGIVSNSSNVSGLVIDGNAIDAVAASASGVIDVVTPDVTVTNNRILTTTAGAYGIRTTSAALRAALCNNTVTVNSGAGILSNGAGTAINGNRVVTTAAAAIEVLGASTAISGNNLAPAGGEGVLVRAARTVVNGNTVTSGTQGVRVGASGAGSSASNSVVNGNTITGCQFWGVNVTSGAVDTVVTSNNLVGNTSGGITDAGTTTTAANNKP